MRPMAIPSDERQDQQIAGRDDDTEPALDPLDRDQAADQSADDRLAAEQEGRLGPAAREFDRILDEVQQAAADKTTERGRADHPPAGSRVDDVTATPTITGVPVEGEAVRERFEHPVRVKDERPESNPNRKSHLRARVRRSARLHSRATDCPRPSWRRRLVAGRLSRCKSPAGRGRGHLMGREATTLRLQSVVQQTAVRNRAPRKSTPLAPFPRTGEALDVDSTPFEQAPPTAYWRVVCTSMIGRARAQVGMGWFGSSGQQLEVRAGQGEGLL